MSFVIRRARAADAAALALVNVTGWRETYAHILSPGFLAGFELEPMQRNWERVLAGERWCTMVAEVHDEVAGYATAGMPKSDEKPRDLELYMIYQLAGQHGSGTGQALLDAVIGDRPAFLWVAERNPRAIAFYRRNGFEPDGTHMVAEQWENLVEIRMVRG